MTASLHKTNPRGHLVLPDGRDVDFDIRLSSRISVCLKVIPTGDVVVSAPYRMPTKLIVAFVTSKAKWIAKRLAQFEEVRRLVNVPAVRPEAIDLPALGESWRVEYRSTPSKTVAARAGGAGEIVVSGAIDDVKACQAALRRWLARRAKDHLVPLLSQIAQETRLKFSDVSLKNQRSRWGSCTRQGCISLNCKLLFFPPELVRYVLLHELCHTVEHNHSERFWALVRRFEPNTDVYRKRMRDAWKWVPGWANL